LGTSLVSANDRNSFTGGTKTGNTGVCLLSKEKKNGEKGGMERLTLADRGRRFSIKQKE